MQAHPITVSESSLLRSPKASEGEGGALGEAEALKRGNTVGVRDQVMDLVAGQGLRVSRASDNDLLPTPRAQEPGSTSPGYGDSLNDFANRVSSGFAPKDLLPTPKARDHQAEGYEAGFRRGQPQVGTLVKAIVDGDDRVLMPTPMSRDYKGDVAPHERDGVIQTDTVERAIFHSGEIELMGTPRTSSANGATAKQVEADAPKSRIEDQVLTTSWGKFEPAIRRWEETIGRPAPAPTKPDGKDGNHRLSSAFTEWMMGLPAGWITEAGLTRNEELKACGNGVVPQQAELALRILLEGVDL